MIGLLNTDHIIQAGGLLAIAAVIFAECGLLIGFILPGDTLLIPAGIWASHHPNQLNIWLLVPVVALAAIVGYQMGYSIGEKAGPKVFKRKGGLLFRKDYIPRTNEFVNKHGGKSMILARFLAVIRTLVPIVAGVGKMPKRRFFIYNVLGAVIWTSVLVLGSYWVGQQINNVDKWIPYIVVSGIVVTGVGELWYVMRNKKSRAAFAQALREEWLYFFKRS